VHDQNAGRCEFGASDAGMSICRIHAKHLGLANGMLAGSLRWVVRSDAQHMVGGD
jgi:hypothetical protein